MASLRRRGGRWQIRFYSSERSPNRKAISYPAQAYTRRQIEQKKVELEYLYNEGEWNPWDDGHPGRGQSGGKSFTVEEAIEEYCQHKRQLGRRDQRGGWNEKTWRDYRVTLRAFSRHVGHRRQVQSLTTEDFGSWIFREGKAEATRRTYRRQLKTFVRWLESEHDIQTGELPRPLKSERDRLRDYPTEEDLLAICHAHRLRCIRQTKKKHVPKSGSKSPLNRWAYTMAFRLSFYQGLRRGEVVELRGGAVDLPRQRLAVGLGFVPKGRHEKVITITPPAMPILECLCKHVSSSEERLFGMTHGKRLSDAFREARREVFPGRDKLNFHSLRRGATVFWLEQGVDSRDMKNILRHASIRTMEKHYDQYVAEGVKERLNSVYRDSK